MALTAAQVAEQKKQVEELLADAGKLGFAKSLFFGRFRGDLVFPYPALPPDQQAAAGEMAGKVKAFADAHIDAARIDRDARIPDGVVRGLGDLGVLGLTAPPVFGGQGFNQRQYLRTMEILGGHCCSTAVFVNAHHSIGVRALLLFGTADQQAKWLPDLMTGRKLAAFALTEPEAGSDAANVQTTAMPTADGTAFVLNGGKHYITNGGIADVLTVMARTPDGTGGTKVTAFLVTPDMPGFEVVEARAEKCGIRGTATGKLRFTDTRVPRENVFGQMGRGLQAALSVLNYGRVTFGATCTGHAKACVKALCDHAKARVQFGQPLAEFQLVRKKAAFAAAHTYAMEATTNVCAALIDRGADDYMLETAILKVFATEHLWTVVNDTIQVWGGKAYFCDQPLERWMRDARINTIGEGANDVLKAFIAVVGCRAPGEYLKGLRDDLAGGRWSVGKLLGGLGAGAKLVAPWSAHTPTVPVSHPELQADARALSALVKQFGTTLPHVFLRLKDEATFVQAQLVHERLADIAIDLFVSACVLSRLDSEDASDAAGRYFLKLAARRIGERFAALDANDDEACPTRRRRIGCEMTEAEWLTSCDVGELFAVAQPCMSSRQIRLLGCVCIRWAWEWGLGEGVPEAVHVAESFVDSMATEGDLRRVADEMGANHIDHEEPYRPYPRTCILTARVCSPDVGRDLLTDFYGFAVEMGVTNDPEWARITEYVRDILGNPFRPVAFDPAWRSSAVTALAAAVYADRAFDRLPVLADALEEAGCDHPDILAHCRGDGPHVRGCWVVDLALGKS